MAETEAQFCSSGMSQKLTHPHGLTFLHLEKALVESRLHVCIPAHNSHDCSDTHVHTNHILTSSKIFGSFILEQLEHSGIRHICCWKSHLNTHAKTLEGIEEFKVYLYPPKIIFDM